MATLLYNLRNGDKRNYQTAKKASFWFRKEGLTGEENFEELGNLIEPSKRIIQEILEHFSNRRGQRSMDRSELVSQKLELDFSIDEITMSNLVKIFGGNDAGKSASTVKVREGRVATNPGGGVLLDLKMLGINADDVVVRSPNQEGAVVTYTADPLTTDTGENTESNDFNNVTSPLTVVGAVATYALITFAVGQIFKLGSEILIVTGISGNDVTFARGQLGTTNAVHANGVDILTSGGTADYVVDATNGKIYILIDGDLDDDSTAPEVHVQWTKTVATEKCALFDGKTLRGEGFFQILTKSGARLVWDLPEIEIRSNGDVALGTGQDWIRLPVKVNVLADEDGDFGEVHVINAAETTG